MRHLVFFSFFILLSLPSTVFAATVSARASTRGSYDRLVLSLPEGKSPLYEIEKPKQNTLRLKLKETDPVGMAPPDLSTASRIKRVHTVSGSPLTIDIETIPGATHRHFTTGSRIILDIVGGQIPEKTTEKQVSKPEPKKTEPEPPAQITETPPQAAAVPPVEVEKEALEEAKKESQIKIEPAAHVATLSSTETMGLAAFIRNGYLWVILDRDDFPIVPQVAGPTPEIFFPFKRHAIEKGSAFSMKLPKDDAFHVYIEGGKLIWRIVLTPKPPPEKHPVEPERQIVWEKDKRTTTLFWPLPDMREMLKFQDPLTGDTLHITTIAQSGSGITPRQMIPEAEILETIAGFVALPKTEDLQITAGTAKGGIRLSHPKGLSLSPERIVRRYRLQKSIEREKEVTRKAAVDPEKTENKDEESARHLFNFKAWKAGGRHKLMANQSALLSGAARKDPEDQAQSFLTLAKMNVTNGQGPEAAGFLRLAAQILPPLSKSAEFKALRGAALALAKDPENALRDLRTPVLDQYGEMDYWRSYVLAELEDWQQAGEVLPPDFNTFALYPLELRNRLGPTLAEIALRAGDTEKADEILDMIQAEKKIQPLWVKAAATYLRGELHRQKGSRDKARKLFEKLVKGKDDFYRVRAGLALTQLDKEAGIIKIMDTIDRLESLRYAWRGDILEAKVNFALGRSYLEKREYMKGFTILRDAASMQPGSDIAQEITNYMAKSFRNLLLFDPELSPLTAMLVYREFAELTPPGADGDNLMRTLAERLTQAELLDRATEILQTQIDNRLKGLERARVAVRTAALYLLDEQPQKALAALDIAEGIYAIPPEQATEEQIEEINQKKREASLLRARALSRLDQTEEALILLHTFDPAPDVNHLRADIAWQAKLWDDAALALRDLILDQAPDPSGPITPEQANLILNRAVALNLSGDRVELANMRNRYGGAMADTNKARPFEVVTRPQQHTTSTNPAAVTAVANEIDMFKAFLEGYRGAEAKEAEQTE